MKPGTLLISVLCLLLAQAASADESAKCSATARECENEIRQMLSGRRYLGINVVDTNPGILIKSINTDGPAARADLVAGDRIIAVNGRSMAAAGVREFKTVLGEVKDGGGMLLLIVQRRSSLRKVEVRLSPYPKSRLDKIITGHLTMSHLIATGQ